MTPKRRVVFNYDPKVAPDFNNRQPFLQTDFQPRCPQDYDLPRMIPPGLPPWSPNRSPTPDRAALPPHPA